MSGAVQVARKRVPDEDRAERRPFRTILIGWPQPLSRVAIQLTNAFDAGTEEVARLQA